MRSPTISKYMPCVVILVNMTPNRLGLIWFARVIFDGFTIIRPKKPVPVLQNGFL